MVNARIIPVVGQMIEHGSIVIEGSQIAAVQGADADIPHDATRVDLQGLSVYPGMVNAGGTILHLTPHRQSLEGLFVQEAQSEAREGAAS